MSFERQAVQRVPDEYAGDLENIRHYGAALWQAICKVRAACRRLVGTARIADSSQAQASDQLKVSGTHVMCLSFFLRMHQHWLRHWLLKPERHRARAIPGKWHSRLPGSEQPSRKSAGRQRQLPEPEHRQWYPTELSKRQQLRQVEDMSLLGYPEFRHDLLRLPPIRFIPDQALQI